MASQWQACVFVENVSPLVQEATGGLLCVSQPNVMDGEGLVLLD